MTKLGVKSMILQLIIISIFLFGEISTTFFTWPIWPTFRQETSHYT